MATKLLLIHGRVLDKDIIKNNVASDTFAIEVDDMDTASSLKGKIDDAVINQTLSGNFTNIGLVYHNTGKRAPFLEYTTGEIDTINTNQTAYNNAMTAYNNAMTSRNEAIELLETDINNTFVATPNDPPVTMTVTDPRTNQSRTITLKKGVKAYTDVYSNNSNISNYGNTLSLTPMTASSDSFTKIIPAFRIAEELDYSFFSREFKSLIDSLKGVYVSIGYIDLISCKVNLDGELNTPSEFYRNNGNEYISPLDYYTNYGITIRYNTGLTGNSLYDGDSKYRGTWNLNMEGSSVSVNVSLLATSGVSLLQAGNSVGYFNSLIESQYKHILGLVDGTIDDEQDMYELMTTALVADLARDYKITRNIDMTTFPFPSESIGFFAIFLGTLDGQGYTVTIGQTIPTYYGFITNFGNGGGSTQIKNTNIVYASNSSGNVLASFNGILIAGGLVGYSRGIIANCTVTYTGAISVNTNSSFGGLVGVNDGTTSVLSGSSVIFNSTASLVSQVYAGGIVGQNISGLVAECNLLAKGNFTLTTSTTNNSYSGGVCGSNENGGGLYNNTVTFNANHGIYSQFCSGGICGINNGNKPIISGCVIYVKGNLEVKARIFPGGICGFNINDGYIKDNSINCDGTALFSQNTDSTGDISCGGIVGLNEAFSYVINCTANYKSSFTIQVEVDNPKWCAGIVGRTQNNATTSKCTMNVGGNFSIVTGTTKNIAAMYLGGICGFASQSTIKDCSLNVNGMNNIISGTTTNSSMFCGGICGFTQNESDINSCSVTFGTNQQVSNMILYGSSYQTFMGGLVGYTVNCVNKNVSNCSAIYNSTLNITSIATLGSVFCGGMYGYIAGSSTINNTSSFNSDVVIQNETTVASGVFTSPIAGRIDNSKVEGDSASYASTCTITCGKSVHYGICTADVYIGGITTGSVNSIISSCSLYIKTVNFLVTNSGTEVVLAGLIAGNYSQSSIIGCSSTFGNNTQFIADNQVGDVYISGMLGQMADDNTNLINNTTTYGDGTKFQIVSPVAVNKVGLVGSLFAIVLPGFYMTIVNNIIKFGNNTTLQVNETIGSYGTSRIGIPYIPGYMNATDSVFSNINTIINNAAISFEPYGIQTIQDGIEYPSRDSNNNALTGIQYPNGTIVSAPSYKINVDIPSSPYTIFIYYEVPRIDTVPPCCSDKCIVQENPQVSNYDITAENEISAGRAIDSDVTRMYQQVNTTGRINSQPIFSSYRDYLMYLQAKNYRR